MELMDYIKQNGDLLSRSVLYNYLDKANLQYRKPLRITIDDNVINVLDDYFIYLLDHDIDSNLSQKVLYWLINHYDLNDYIKKIYFVDSEDFVKKFNMSFNSLSFGTYESINKELYIIKDSFDKLKNHYNNKGMIIFEFFETIIHEFEHAMQEKSNDVIGGSIKELLDIGNLLYLINNHKYYLENHDLFPAELDAILTSGVFLYDFSNKSNRFRSNFGLYKIVNDLLIGNKTNEELDKLCFINDKFNVLFNKIFQTNFDTKIFNLTEQDNLYYGLLLNNSNVRVLNNSIRNFNRSRLDLNENTKSLIRK